MADGGLTLLEGTLLRASLPHLPSPNGAVTGANLLAMAESAASSALYGLSLPEDLKSAALKRINADSASFASTEYEEAKAASILRDYVAALADELKDDPLVVSILDGSALRLFLDDEDDFAMLAENLFTDLDTKDKGKLGKTEIRSALIQMGVDMGVPPFSESGELLNDILKKHGAEGDEELGQAQFAQLLQHVLQDLADALAVKQVIVIQNIKVINGSKLRKVLADEELLDDVIERIIQDQSVNEDGRGSIEKIRFFLEKNGIELGLPSVEANEAVALLYDQVFSDTNRDQNGGKLGKNELGIVVKNILKEFAEQLQANPIFYDLEN